MLTYLPKNQQSTDSTQKYPWLLMLLVFVWLWPGIFSHDLWKPQEPHLYQVIDETTSYFFPTLLGDAYFQAAPIYIWTAQWTRYLLSPWATDVYSAARFATVIFTALGLTATGMAASRLLGKSYGHSVVLMLIGSAGLLGMGHFLSSMSVAFAGVGLALWGLSVAERQVVFAAFLLTIGILFLSQSVGWLFSGCLLCVAWLLSLTQQWRSVRYFSVLLATMAMVIPLIGLQILVMTKINPVATQHYWHLYVFGAYGGVGNLHANWNILYYLYHFLWFGFPAYPLAIWTLWRGRRHHWWQTRWGVLCVAWVVIFLALLAVNPQSYQDNLIVILPAVAIFGAAQLDNLRRGVAAFLNWFGIMLFGLMAAFLWVGFVAMNYGFPAKLAERAVYFSPFYTRDINIMPMVVAILFTPAWIFAITRKRIRGRQAVNNWASGMTLVWALLLTLFLPWLDAAKSYRPVVQQMEAKLPDASTTDCVYIAPQHTVARLAWREYSFVKTVSDESGKRCLYELIQYQQDADLHNINPQNIIWQGKRPRQKMEMFALVKHS